jgi:hypothetical protein
MAMRHLGYLEENFKKKVLTVLVECDERNGVMKGMSL